MHKDAPAAHHASVAAHKQGKFWEFHDKLFLDRRQFNIEKFRAYARVLELDMEQFEKDLLDLENKKPIDADKAEASSMGITGTPAFFINGRYLSGAKPFGEFAKLINVELEQLNLEVPVEAKVQ